MKNIVIISSILLLASNLCAQQINYTIEQDEPDYTNLIVGIEPFYIDASKLNFPLGVGVSGMYTGAPIQVNFVYNRALFDFNKASLNAHSGLKPHSALELGIGFPLINTNKAKNLKVTLSESTSGGYTTTKFIMVPGTIKRTVAVRGGLYRYRNSYSNEDYGDIVLDSITMVASVQDYSPGANQWEAFYGNITVNALYAGISITGITNLRISSTDFNGYRKNAAFNNFYFDAMFAPLINLGTYTHIPAIGDANNLLAAGNYDLNDSYSKRRLGFRMGWQGNRAFQMGTKSRVGFYHRMEAGSRPGIKGGNWYLLLAVGIGINGKV